MPETPKVPPAAPVGNLSELLFEREDGDEVLVVIGRNGLDDITIKTSEEEKNAILDLLYAADLREWEDCEREGGANADFKIRSGETEVKLSVYDGIEGITDGESSILRSAMRTGSRLRKSKAQRVPLISRAFPDWLRVCGLIPMTRAIPARLMFRQREKKPSSIKAPAAMHYISLKLRLRKKRLILRRSRPPMTSGSKSAIRFMSFRVIPGSLPGQMRMERLTER